jgi:hypothetical protein
VAEKAPETSATTHAPRSLPSTMYALPAEAVTPDSGNRVIVPLLL